MFMSKRKKVPAVAIAQYIRLNSIETEAHVVERFGVPKSSVSKSNKKINRECKP